MRPAGGCRYRVPKMDGCICSRCCRPDQERHGDHRLDEDAEPQRRSAVLWLLRNVPQVRMAWRQLDQCCGEETQALGQLSHRPNGDLVLFPLVLAEAAA